MRHLVERRDVGYIWCATSGCAPASGSRLWSGSPTPTPSARSALTVARRCGRCAASAGSATRTICRCSHRSPLRETEPDAKLPPMPLGAHVVEDYRRLSLSLKAHPVSFMRARLDARSVIAATRSPTLKNGERVAVAGLVLVRQRPGTATGVIFMTLEDEAGVANVIVWPKAFERLRAIVSARVSRRHRQAAERAGRHPYRRRPDGGSDADARPPLGSGRTIERAARPTRSAARKCRWRRSARATASPRPRASTLLACLPVAALETSTRSGRRCPTGRNFHLGHDPKSPLGGYWRGLDVLTLRSGQEGRYD